jgi:hypothetical protein
LGELSEICGMEKPVDKKEGDENPEKYFDETNYHTLIVGSEEPEVKAKPEDLIELLAKSDRELKEKALELIKTKNAKDVLMNAISTFRNKKELPVLVAACWESGLDFSDHFTEFISLAVENDYLTTLEAFTVIEQMEGEIEEKSVTEAINIVKKEIEMKNDKMNLLEDLIEILQLRLNS